MSDTDTISVSQLIELVRDRPVLWDRQKEVYKNRKLTRKAWVDICETLIENYDELSDQEQKAIGRSVISKWANLRDNWLRYWRKRQQLLLSGSSTTTLKKYIHHDQLLFLSKVYDPECQQEVEEIQVDVDVISDAEMESSPALSSGETSQNMWSFQEEEISKPSEEDGHIYFFHSVLPFIKDFNNEQTIDFQMAVFDCIKRIRVKAVNNQFFNPPRCQNLYQHQESLHRNISSTEHSAYTQEFFPQYPPETALKQKFNGSSFIEIVNDKEFYKETKEENNSESKPPLTQESENSSRNSQDLSNLNRAISKLEKISKKISVSTVGDGYDRFGRYVVSLLRKFSPKNIKFFKRKLIKYIKSHLVSTSKQLQAFVRSQKMSQQCRGSQDSRRQFSKDLNTYQNELSTRTPENDTKCTEDHKAASESCDSHKVSAYKSFSEEPVHVSPNTFSKFNQSPNNKTGKSSVLL